ncbi:MAG TPA: CapA family protein [Candidatus Baltobacteraceae bacterium]|nr:CapA family protein [Candidatus Baltobacteraceae bacterium]
MSARGLLLWESNEQAVTRIAVAGDFLPAGALKLTGSGAWSEAAGALAPCFEDVEATFLNLECPIDADGLTPRKLAGLGAIVSASAAALDYLAPIRVAAVGFANNHAYDFAGAGVERTQRACNRRNLPLIGAGHDTNTPPDVRVWQGPGAIKVGFWAAAKACHDLADHTHQGVEPATLRRARQALGRIRSEGASFSVALLHAGILRTNRPDPSDAKLMDAIAGAGFDLVVASHSHRISGHKRVTGDRGSPAFCFYGLGSLVSGYTASPLEREGLIVIAGLNSLGKLASLEVRPVSLAASGFGEAPSEEAARAILKRFEQLSAEITDGSSKRRFYQEISQSLVRLYLRDVSAAFRESGMRGLAVKAGRLRLRHLRRLAHGLLP